MNANLLSGLLSNFMAVSKSLYFGQGDAKAANSLMKRGIYHILYAEFSEAEENLKDAYYLAEKIDLSDVAITSALLLSDLIAIEKGSHSSNKNEFLEYSMEGSEWKKRVYEHHRLVLNRMLNLRLFFLRSRQKMPTQ